MMREKLENILLYLHVHHTCFTHMKSMRKKTRTHEKIDFVRILNKPMK